MEFLLRNFSLKRNAEGGGGGGVWMSSDRMAAHRFTAGEQKRAMEKHPFCTQTRVVGGRGGWGGGLSSPPFENFCPRLTGRATKRDAAYLNRLLPEGPPTHTSKKGIGEDLGKWIRRNLKRGAEGFNFFPVFLFSFNLFPCPPPPRAIQLQVSLGRGPVKLFPPLFS